MGHSRQGKKARQDAHINPVYQFNRKANCVCRPVLTTLAMVPAASEPMLVLGYPKFAIAEPSSKSESAANEAANLMFFLLPSERELYRAVTLRSKTARVKDSGRDTLPAGCLVRPVDAKAEFPETYKSPIEL